MGLDPDRDWTPIERQCQFDLPEPGKSIAINRRSRHGRYRRFPMVGVTGDDHRDPQAVFRQLGGGLPRRQQRRLDALNEHDDPGRAAAARRFGSLVETLEATKIDAQRLGWSAAALMSASMLTPGQFTGVDHVVGKA